MSEKKWKAARASMRAILKNEQAFPPRTRKRVRTLRAKNEPIAYSYTHAPSMRVLHARRQRRSSGRDA